MSENSTQSAFGNVSVGTVDLAVIAVYLFICLLVGIWATWKTQRGSLSGYFLAGRDQLWISVGASIFASNIGSGILVGLAGGGAAGGIAVSSYELHGLLTFLLLAWVFMPVYIASGVFTLPEYLRKRFGGNRLQVFMAVYSLLIYIFTKISADMFAGAIFIQQTVGWNIYPATLLLLAITAIYTISGGLKAVMYTDTLQTFIMVIGSVILMGISFNEVGGMNRLYYKYLHSVPTSMVNGSDCGLPRPEAFHIFRDAETGDLPWTGNILGIPILASWYVCADQVLVQRSLAAKNMHHVKGGSIFAAYLKPLVMFTAVFPGMISRVLFTDQVGCADPHVCQAVCDNSAGCSNIAYPKLVVELLPVGIKGVMLAAMMAALMSSLTSVFNSSSTIFTMDIWKRIRPRAKEGELLVVGRMFILVLVGVTIAWLPILQAFQGGQLFNYIQSVTGYLAPPVLALYLLAIFWKRTNEQGAFWGLLWGFVVGIIRMGLDFGYGTPNCGETDTRPTLLSKVHFLHFAVILFVISLLTIAIVSLLTRPLPDQKLIRLTWWSRHDDDVATNTRSDPRIDLNEDVEPDCEIRVAKNEIPSTKLQKLPLWRRVIYVICGYEPPTENKKAYEETQEHILRFTSIKEDPRWKMFVDINCVVLILLVVFLWGFWA